MNKHFKPLKLDIWRRFQQIEAKERGYDVRFVGVGLHTVAMYFNREFFLYARAYYPEEIDHA